MNDIRKYSTRPENMTTNKHDHGSGPTVEDVTRNDFHQHVVSHTDHMSSSTKKDSDNGTLESPPRVANQNFSKGGSLSSRSVGKSDRVLRPKMQEKPEAPSNIVAEVSSVREKKRKKKEKRKDIPEDEFTRIRKKCRYFLNRMSYEQNFIAVYSGEGWKRQSVDKIKPEKELQRAASEIIRCKLKIRDVFQHLDSVCAEGRFPETLFDSDGQIDSEDIFCAKCGSKDLSAGIDIILCDGVCDRGFHLLCLQPPLSLEDLPSDEEGWLCPGCDCKDDCMDLLNDSQGTSHSITDSWEKIFPEAVASPGGNMHDNELPSNDSEDDDYDPHTQVVAKKLLGDADDSDSDSASHELAAPANLDQFLGLPSDDSEDDDYNPTAPIPDEQVMQDSSSSDFTSDSEDLDAVLDDNNKERGRARSKSKNKSHLSDELLTEPETDLAQTNCVPISGRRHLEKLDYKKLYDETYSNLPSSSSDDDDDWTDNDSPKKRKNKAGRLAHGSSNEKTTENSSKQRTLPRLNRIASNTSSVKSQNGSPSPGEKIRVKLEGEALNQRLYTAFKENLFPDRDAKKKLAEELGITVPQITKWFANARWSARNHPSGLAARAVKSCQDEVPSPQNTEKLGPGSEKSGGDPICKINKKTKSPKQVDAKEDKKPSTPNSRKRKNE